MSRSGKGMRRVLNSLQEEGRATGKYELVIAVVALVVVILVLLSPQLASTLRHVVSEALKLRP